MRCVINALENRNKNKAVYEEFLVFMFKMSGLRDLFDSPQIEQAINSIVEIVRSNKFDASLQRYGFQALGAMGLSGNRNLKKIILKTGIIDEINGLSFRWPENIEAALSLLLLTEEADNVTKSKVRTLHGKKILESLERSDTSKKARDLGYKVALLLGVHEPESGHDNNNTGAITGKMDEKEELKSPIADMYEKIPHNFYETFENSLRVADFVDTEDLLNYSKKKAECLRELEVLEKYRITQSDAMALTVYTYDNRPDDFESNPYRVVNKALARRDTQLALKLKGYILRLIAALRKLPKYRSDITGNENKLYRATTNISMNTRHVGNVLRWPGFTSTFTTEGAAVKFLNKNIANVSGNKYIFEISGCFDKGHNIKEFSFRPDEEGNKS